MENLSAYASGKDKVEPQEVSIANYNKKITNLIKKKNWIIRQKC